MMPDRRHPWRGWSLCGWAGLALAPGKADSRWDKVAFSGSLLLGDGVDGWSFGVGLRD